MQLQNLFCATEYVHKYHVCKVHTGSTSKEIVSKLLQGNKWANKEVINKCIGGINTCSEVGECIK
jgi:hypothetical protein